MSQTDVMPAIEPRIGKTSDPCAMVIFGASGDLTRRKLIPALYNLAKNELLSREFAVIGVARSPMSTEDYRKRVSEDIKKFATSDVDPDIWEWFIRRMHYLSGDMGDKNLYLQLKDLLDKIDKDHSTHGNHMYYMATSADFLGRPWSNWLPLA
jgi:glucose-6-phosphate 1-dehydrogenase